MSSNTQENSNLQQKQQTQNFNLDEKVSNTIQNGTTDQEEIINENSKNAQNLNQQNQIDEEQKIAPNIQQTQQNQQNTSYKLVKKPQPQQQQQQQQQQTKGHQFDSVKIAVIGNVDSGKSTLVGVLTKGQQDDGRGAARLKVFNYPHEAQNGRTSSIAHEIIGFNPDGQQVLPERFNQNKNKYWSEVMQKSSKCVSLIDLCGHEKYLKTTMFGLIGTYPDYAMIIVGANMGISRMTKEHLGITLALKIPFFIIITKVDICPPNILKETTDQLNKILKSSQVGRVPIWIKPGQTKEVQYCAQNLSIGKICPIFPISNVTLEGIPQLIKLLSLVQDRNNINKMLNNEKDTFEFDIQEHFMVPQVGIVVSGVIKSGTAKIGQQVQLGPDERRQFKQVVIKSIHLNRVPTEEAHLGQFVCFAIKALKVQEKLNREDFRKGMILLDQNLNPEPVWEFESEILVLHHSSTITIGYQAVMHCGVVRQAVKIVNMPQDLLRNGDKSLVRFRFLYNAEYLQKDQTILLREGKTKMLGQITQLFTDSVYNQNIIMEKQEGQQDQQTQQLQQQQQLSTTNNSAKKQHRQIQKSEQSTTQQQQQHKQDQQQQQQQIQNKNAQDETNTQNQHQKQTEKNLKQQHNQHSQQQELQLTTNNATTTTAATIDESNKKHNKKNEFKKK